MRNIDKLKQFLKETAKEIRRARFEYKEAQRGKNTTGKHPYVLAGRLHHLSYEFRHHHIAYCELRGRLREQIERPKDNHLPNETKINNIKEAYAWSPEEIDAYQERKAKRETLRISA
jgi:hypothetical protein